MDNVSNQTDNSTRTPCAFNRRTALLSRKRIGIAVEKNKSLISLLPAIASFGTTLPQNLYATCGGPNGNGFLTAM